MHKKQNSFISFLIVLLLFIIAMRLISLGMYALMDTTEARYGEMSRKILETKNWITIYYDYNVPFWGKPPLSFWASAITMKVFGINEFGARFAPFVAAMLIGLLFFTWKYPLNQMFYKNMQFNRAYLIPPTASFIIFMSCGLGFVAAGAVMTDEFLLLSIMMCMIGFFKCVISNKDSSKIKQTIWGYIFFIGLSVGLLAKGPLIFVLVGTPVFAWCVFYMIVKKRFNKLNIKPNAESNILNKLESPNPLYPTTNLDSKHNTQYTNKNTKTSLFDCLFYHQNFDVNFKNLPIFSGIILTLLISLPWYILAEIKTPGFLEYFIIGEHIKRFLVSGWEGDLYGNAHANPLGMIWLFGGWAFLPYSLVFPIILIWYFLSKNSTNSLQSAESKIIDSTKNSLNKESSKDSTLTNSSKTSIYKSINKQTRYAKATKLATFFTKISNNFVYKNYELVYLSLWILTPFVFFTFAKNILEAYTLPALGAFSILLVNLIFGMNNKFSIRIWYIPALIISIFTIFMIYPGIDSVATRHYKIFFSNWDKNSNLMCVEYHPSYSGQFYTQGKCKYYKIDKIQEILQYSKANNNEEKDLHNADSKITIAIPIKIYENNKELFKNFVIIARKNDLIMIKKH
ncbi:MAG: hypothetical protein K2P17_07505 [Helicobacteraceae bacterium]|nr:hypothetical protein [Helicobacteraceae bacterium]